MHVQLRRGTLRICSGFYSRVPRMKRKDHFMGEKRPFWQKLMAYVLENFQSILV